MSKSPHRTDVGSEALVGAARNTLTEIPVEPDVLDKLRGTPIGLSRKTISQRPAHTEGAPSCCLPGIARIFTQLVQFITRG